MTKIELVGYVRNDRGKPAFVHCLIDGRKKSLSKKQLWDMVEVLLPDDQAEPQGNGATRDSSHARS